MNLPLPKRCGAPKYAQALERSLEAVARHSVSAIVVSLGLDTYHLELGGGLGLRQEDYRRIGAAVADLGRPLVIIQEGGYYLADLGHNLCSWLDGVEDVIDRTRSRTDRKQLGFEG
jgi:acetoin utilization deacetylase AcuC-like enzyme